MSVILSNMYGHTVVTPKGVFHTVHVKCDTLTLTHINRYNAIHRSIQSKAIRNIFIEFNQFFVCYIYNIYVHNVIESYL